MTKKLYVGNLPFSATEEQVRELFNQFGTIQSIAMINDRDTGRFRGFCFVEMDDAEADDAIDGLNDHDMGGRALRVNEARPREERGGRGQRGNQGYRSGGGKFPDSGGGRDRY